MFARNPVMPERRSYFEVAASWAPFEMRILILVLAACVLNDVSLKAAPPVFPEAKSFIEKHCADCHDDVTREAGLDLTALPFDAEDKANLALWIKVHDRVKAGEMPPKKKKTRPDSVAVEEFVKRMASELTKSEKAIIARDGRAMQRRLNRYELPECAPRSFERAVGSNTESADGGR